MRLILITVLVLSAYFVPASFTVRPEYLLVTAMGVVGLLLRGGDLLRSVGREFVLLYALAAAAGISLLIQILVGSPVIPRDFMILLRYVIYSFAILAGAYASLNLKVVWPVKLLLLLLVFGSIAISFLQYFNLFGVNNFMVPFYGEKYQTLIVGMSWRRIIGTIGNPNYWGLWLALCFSVFYCGIIINRKIYFMPIAFLLFISIVMTGSRTAMLSCLFGASLGIYVIRKRLSASYDKGNIIVKIIVPIFFIAVTILLFKLFSGYYYDNHERFSFHNIHTLKLRINHWSNFLGELYQKPYQLLIGRGPTKGVNVTFGDNSYLMIFRDYGVLSISIFFSFLIVIYRKISRSIASPGRSSKQAFSIALVLLLTFVIFDLAADAWFNVRLVIPLLFGYGYLMGKKGLELSTTSEQPC